MDIVFRRSNIFWILVFGFSSPLILLIVLTLGEMLVEPSGEQLLQALSDKKVMKCIARSIYTALAAACIAFAFGTPLAYLMARKSFPGKKIIEGIIDLPIMIPHPVIGIAILSLLGKHHPIGKMLHEIGFRVMGTAGGIITVMLFVGMPFYVNAVKNGFENISPRLENVSRSLGAGMASTFFRVDFPLAWRDMVLGAIMCTARAISEFGAVVIVAYHPMTAPVLIYERFTAYGLKYSQPVAFWLIVISLALFVGMRFFSRQAQRT